MRISLPARIRTILMTLWLIALTVTRAKAQAAERIESITVTGDESRINLQLAIDTAEDHFYSLFNDLVGDEEFQVTCKYQVLLGSRIKQRLCQTGYMREALSSVAIMSFSGVTTSANVQLITKNTEMRAKARELIQANPTLRSAAERLSDLVGQYKDKYQAGN